jgi:hypothetical protein
MSSLYRLFVERLPVGIDIVPTWSTSVEPETKPKNVQLCWRVCILSVSRYRNTFGISLQLTNIQCFSVLFCGDLVLFLYLARIVVLWWFSFVFVFGAYCQVDSVTILMKVSNNRVNNSIDKKCVIDKLHHIILYNEYTSPLAGFEFTTLVLISTNSTGGFKHRHLTDGP